MAPSMDKQRGIRVPQTGSVLGLSTPPVLRQALPGTSVVELWRGWGASFSLIEMGGRRTNSKSWPHVYFCLAAC